VLPLAFAAADVLGFERIVPTLSGA